jgi:hypothetical protein
MDDLVDAVNGYLFTLVVLSLLIPVVLCRPFLMLLAYMSFKTATSMEHWLARRRVALSVVADRAK